MLDFSTLTRRRLHKCPKCGQVIQVCEFQAANVSEWLLYNFGLDRGRWTKCGSHNETHEIN